MLINSQPIVDETAGGAIRGTFVVGRWIDAAVVAELGARTRLDLSLVAPGSTDLPTQVRDAAASTATAGTMDATFVIPRDTSTVIGYSVLQDVFGRPALVMQVEMPRAVYAQGASSVRYFTLSLFALVVVFGIVLNQLLERSLFRRLAGITAQVRHIRPGRAKLEPITAGGKDELGLLAETINAGFSQLEADPHAAGDPGQEPRPPRSRSSTAATRTSRSHTCVSSSCNM